MAAELSQKGTCIAIPADLSTEEECRRLAGEMAEREDSLDILVNNAGATWGTPLADFDEAAFERVLSLNVKGVFHLTKFLVPLLEAAGTAEEPARVINIGSIDGIAVPTLETYSYSASKAAVHQLTRHLAKRLAPRVTVNAIAPGPFESKMMAATLEAFGEQIAAERAAEAHRPARRHGGRRHLPVVAGRGLPDRGDHPGRRGHRHHSLEPTRPDTSTHPTPTRQKGGTPCCCCTKFTGSPAPRRTPSTTPTATSYMPALAKSDGQQAAVVPAACPRQRAGLHHRHHHRLPRRGGVGGAGRARARRRPGRVVGRGGRHAPRVRRPR